MSEFYDRMASLYHLIFRDWDESIERQAGQLTDVIWERWGAGAQTILDVSCGIGTQAIGLAKRGFIVTASDLSDGAVARAKDEARRRSVEIDFSVCFRSWNRTLPLPRPYLTEARPILLRGWLSPGLPSNPESSTRTAASSAEPLE
jgi:SAM-dependent methyltransferase